MKYKHNLRGIEERTQKKARRVRLCFDSTLNAIGWMARLRKERERDREREREREREEEREREGGREKANVEFAREFAGNFETQLRRGAYRADVRD